MVGVYGKPPFHTIANAYCNDTKLPLILFKAIHEGVAPSSLDRQSSIITIILMDQNVVLSNSVSLPLLPLLGKRLSYFTSRTMSKTGLYGCE
jgi:hypothetical protein